MADINSRASLEVEVQGIAGLKSLNAELDKVRKAGRPQAVEAGGKVDPTVYKWTYDFFNSIRQTIITSGRAIGASLRSFTGSLGRIAVAGGLAGTALIGLGVAVTGLAIPLFNLVAGFRLLRQSFDWAQEAAQQQITVAGRTRRFYPQLLGEGLEAAEDEMRARMGVTTALFGSAADSMQEQVTRRFSEFRLGRGLRGEKDIFRRWGITPQSLSNYERLTGSRVDLNRWLRLFIIQREKLEDQLSRAQTPQEKQMLRRRLALLADDTTKLFGQRFSDMVMSMNNRDMAKLERNIKQAIPLGHVENYTRKSIEFTISLKSLQQTFKNIALGIGGDVQPAITSFLEAMNEKLIDVSEGGQGLGRAFRELASSMATKTWDVLRDLMERIDPDRVNGWIAAIQEWKPAETAETVKTIFNAIVTVGKAMAAVISAVNAFADILPTWITGRKGREGVFGELGGLQPIAPGGEAAEAGGGGFAGEPAAGGGAAPAAVGPGPAAAGAAAQPAAPGPAVAGPTLPSVTAPSGPTAGEGGAGFGAAPAGLAAAPAPPAAAAAPPAAAAPGPPAPTPEVAAGATPEAERGWLGRTWDRLRGRRAEAAEPMVQTAAYRPQAQADLQALRATAAGRAMVMSADVERGPMGDTLIMRTSAKTPAEQTAAPAAAAWGAYGVGYAAELAGIPGAGAVGHAVGRAGMYPEAGFGELARGMIPGMGTLEMMKRDDAAGNPMRDQMREYLGISEESGEFPPRPEGRAEPNRRVFGSRLFGGGEGGFMSRAGGWAWGQAASDSIADRLSGMSISSGYAATSYGVTPRSAPKPTGGDTATEA